MGNKKIFNNYYNQKQAEDISPQQNQVNDLGRKLQEVEDKIELYRGYHAGEPGGDEYTDYDREIQILLHQKHSIKDKLREYGVDPEVMYTDSRGASDDTRVKASAGEQKEADWKALPKTEKYFNQYWKNKSKKAYQERFPSVQEVSDYLYNMVKNSQPLQEGSEYPINIIKNIVELVDAGRTSDEQALEQINELVNNVGMQEIERSPHDTFATMVEDTNAIPMVMEAIDQVAQELLNEEKGELQLQKEVY